MLRSTKSFKSRLFQMRSLRPSFLSFAFSFLFLNQWSYSQLRTLGLMQNQAGSYNGYTLLAPMLHKGIYLLDNCGRKVHSWSSNFEPGANTYLLENGHILRTNNVQNNVFNTGGSGGRVEMLDWESKVVWSYEYSSNTYCQHHDVHPMPNGNVMMIAWEAKSPAEAKALGWKNSSTVLWPDHLVEVKPLGKDSGEIVWEWHLWDHLIQDYDSSKPNYGVVSEHPELVDLNFLSTRADWTHFNAIDYNPTLDQVIISNHSFSEIWIIDHSTTTAESASHQGGKYGKGGDLLYRWGNKLAYKKGIYQEKTLYMPHNVQWIKDGLKDAGKILYYNNGADRPGLMYSSVEIIDPPQSSPGVYSMKPNGTYGPDTAYWIYEAVDKPTFFSPFISSAQRLPNGNTLICEGVKGHLFEIDQAKKTVWEYISPIGQSGPASQGDTMSGNLVFQAKKYSQWYPGLAGKQLTPQGFVENNPLTDSCSIMPNTGIFNKKVNGIDLYPNPVKSVLKIARQSASDGLLEIYNPTGQLVFTSELNGSMAEVNISFLETGMYFITVKDEQGTCSLLQKIIKE